jgi:hypothetical protein
MSVSYPSQSEYGHHGLRICSPVCLLVCSYMRAAHSLYLDKFPNARQPELLNSILPDMPHVTCHEAAGLIHPLSHQAPDEEEVKVEEVEGLCICDLSTLLRSRADHKQCSSALIVTMAGHSTAYLFHQVKTLPLRMGAHWVCTGMRRARKGLRGRMLYVPLTTTYITI